jgi:predicted nuclease of predicted toxin-antitoxin system
MRWPTAARSSADEIIAAARAPQEFRHSGFQRPRARVKFLVDESLSSELVTIARSRGHWESTHVTWLGLRSRKDWSNVRRAITGGYVLVTNNTADFISLLRRQKVHAGLVCFNVVHGLMSLNVQKPLFTPALIASGIPSRSTNWWRLRLWKTAQSVSSGMIYRSDSVAFRHRPIGRTRLQARVSWAATGLDCTSQSYALYCTQSIT